MNTVAAALALIAAVPVLAKPVRPTPLPIARLIQNVGAFVKSHPTDASAVYTLGRIHYFAFASPTSKPRDGGFGTPDALNTVGGDPVPSLFGFADNPGKGRSAGPAYYTRTQAQQVEHVRQAVTLLGKALALRGSSKESPGLYELCLACALEDGSPWARQVGAIPGVVASGDPRAWREAAIAHYRLAHERALSADLKEETVFGPSVTEEAGRLYTSLVTRRGPTDAERAYLVKVAANLAKLPKQNAVTPIVFSLESTSGLGSLLAPNTRVSFDMDGSGRPQKLSWVKPGTGILVWNEDGSGKITSGRQLFGSVTWWMFWQDGYRALDALDDDRDGWLTGNELKGLAAWFDRNQNGVSEPGEVVGLSQVGVVGIATQATGKDGISPMNAAGLRLRHGRTLPTFDWVVDVKIGAER